MGRFAFIKRIDNKIGANKIDYGGRKYCVQSGVNGRNFYAG